MNVNVRQEQEVYIFAIEGRLGAENVNDFKTIFESYQNFPYHYIFDLSSLEFLDSTGLGAIVRCMKTAQEHDGKLIIVGLNGKPKMVFEITRAYKIFDIYDHLDAALSALNTH